jgi:hypothetical protein
MGKLMIIAIACSIRSVGQKNFFSRTRAVSSRIGWETATSSLPSIAKWRRRMGVPPNINALT